MDTMIDRTARSSWSFDVFVSFRGEDTRFNFVSHLNLALRQKGINVFIDEKLSRGEEISSSLLKAIEEAQISIVLISENYASSSWCLDELVKIMECKKLKEIFPIFYKVDPSDVRKQTGSFGEALENHGLVRSINQIQSWSNALNAISNISAILVRENEDEANCIKKIVEEALNKLNRTVSLHVAKYPVGIDFQIQFKSLLSHIMSDGITMVGIYGIGGMGKTTLAKALYNKIANRFEGRSFLANVREASTQFHGLVQLQEMLLSEILGDVIKVSNVDRETNIIKKRLQSKRILLVLDDINECDQLDVLAGGHDWFGRGTKIIVTTRNKHLLSSHGFDLQYPIQKLSNDKSLELFSWHAFKKSDPSSDYLNLSRRAIDYCKGLPLALVVLGSFLCRRDQSKWEKILDAYENSSLLDEGIQNILRLSYDGLDIDTKEIFLDVSCCFVGQYMSDVEMFLEACGLCPEKGLTRLMDLSLFTIDQYFRVEMHELIQQMGQTIALVEPSTNPRKRKRLFTKDDVESVLMDNKETREVKAIKLNFSNLMELDIDAQGLKNVPNLKFLQVQNATFSGDLEYLPNTLKWIDWPQFPFSSFPPSYMSKNLIRLNLPASSIKHLGKGFMNWESLKRVNLSGSKYLVEIPDFSTAVNLENLNLAHCKNLVKVHESIGSLGKLVDFDLLGCSNLEQLPSTLKCKSLKTFSVGECKRLAQFPHISEEMKSFSLLILRSLEETNLNELSQSIGNLPKLQSLCIMECKNLTSLPFYCLIKFKSLSVMYCSSFSTFIGPFPSSSSILYSNLQSLDLRDCNISDLSFLDTLSRTVDPSILLHLYLSENKFSSLPSCIVDFTSLREFEINDCKFLEEILKVPTCVNNMDAEGCTSLARFPDNIADMISCDVEYEYSEIFGYVFRHLVLMNSDIPEWYDYKNDKSSIIRFWIEYDPSRKIKAFAPCVIFEVYDHYPTVCMDGVYIDCKVSINNTQVWSSGRVSFRGPSSSSSSCVQYMWLLVINDEFLDEMEIHDELEPSIWIDSMTQDWNNYTVSFEICEELDKDIVNIRRCGVHVAYEE